MPRSHLPVGLIVLLASGCPLAPPSLDGLRPPQDAGDLFGPGGDAGRPVDAGERGDADAGTDSGPRADAGADAGRSDAGAGADADAGVFGDAGAGDDGGAGVDAGMSADAGGGVDAGADAMDGGPEPADAGLDAGPTLPPAIVSDLVLWLRADEAGSGGVDNWADASGNGNDVTASGGNRPAGGANTQNGLGLVTFDGTTDRMNGPAVIVGSGPRTVVMLARPTAYDATSDEQRTIVELDRSAGVAAGESYAVTVEVALRVNGNERYDAQLPLNSFSILMVGSGTDATIDEARAWLDGAELGQASFSDRGGVLNTTNGGVQIGHSGYLQQFRESHFAGDIAEIMVFDVLLTATERDAVNAYLRARWGL